MMMMMMVVMMMVRTMVRMMAIIRNYRMEQVACIVPILPPAWSTPDNGWGRLALEALDDDGDDNDDDISQYQVKVKIS